MYKLKAEYRDTNIKAKKLRKAGIIPSCIYGISLEESIPIQILETELRNMLKENSKGSSLSVDLGDKQYHVLLKDITNNILKNQIEHIEFQNLVADEAINSVAQVILLNRDKNKYLVQQFVEEIPYNALPAHLVEKVEIDVESLEEGTTMNLGDLEISKNENIKLLMEEDIAVFSIVDVSRVIADETTDEDGEDTDADATAEEAASEEA